MMNFAEHWACHQILSIAEISTCFQITTMIYITNGSKGRVYSINNVVMTLGKFAEILSYAASHADAKEGMNIRRLLRLFSTSDDWQRLDISPDQFPEYPVKGLDETNNFVLHCETWAYGVIEIFRKNKQFTHVGLQLQIQPGPILRNKRKVQCAKEVFSAATESYGPPIGHLPYSPDGNTGIWRNESTICFVGSAVRPTRLVTYRVWNRTFWNPGLTDLHAIPTFH